VPASFARAALFFCPVHPAQRGGGAQKTLAVSFAPCSSVLCEQLLDAADSFAGGGLLEKSLSRALGRRASSSFNLLKKSISPRGS